MLSRNMVLASLLIGSSSVAEDVPISKAVEAVRQGAVENICQTVGGVVGFYVTCKMIEKGNDKELHCYRESTLKGRRSVEVQASAEGGEALRVVSNGMSLAMSDQAVLLADIWLRGHAVQIERRLKELQLLRGQAARELQEKLFNETTVKARGECLHALAPPSLDKPLSAWGADD